MACVACVAGVERPARVAAVVHKQTLQLPRDPGNNTVEAAPDAHLDELRICYTQAQILRRASAAAEPAAAVQSDVQAAAARVTRAERCLAAMQQFAQAARDPGATVEVAPRHRLSQDELRGALAEAHHAAAAKLEAVKGERDRVRARWLRVLYGDRLKVFNAHPDELPEYEGKARGPLPASVLPRWQYQGADGRAVIYLFRGNRLISKKVTDPRRS